MRRSQTFAGHVSEAGTLATMLQNLGAPQDALVVMDAGIATEANSQWLRKTGYGYLVVSRERSRHKMRMTLSRSKPLPRKRYAAKKYSPKTGKKFGFIATHPAVNKKNTRWRNASPVILKPHLTL